MSVYINGVEQAAPHKATHQDTGVDEISVAALSGELADRQLSKTGTSVLGWTNLKLLRGAGAGNAPTEIDVPTGATTFAALTDVKVVRKTADETVNNSSILQNDDHLLFAIAASEVWEFRIFLYMAIKSASDLKCTVTAPVACTIFGMLSNVEVINTVAESILIAADSNYFAVYQGIAINGANAGNIQFQWAQNAAVAENTIVYANSFIIAHRIV